MSGRGKRKPSPSNQPVVNHRKVSYTGGGSHDPYQQAPYGQQVEGAPHTDRGSYNSYQQTPYGRQIEGVPYTDRDSHDSQQTLSVPPQGRTPQAAGTSDGSNQSPQSAPPPKIQDIRPQAHVSSRGSPAGGSVIPHGQQSRKGDGGLTLPSFYATEYINVKNISMEVRCQADADGYKIETAESFFCCEEFCEGLAVQFSDIKNELTVGDDFVTAPSQTRGGPERHWGLFSRMAKFLDLTIKVRIEKDITLSTDGRVFYHKLLSDPRCDDPTEEIPYMLKFGAGKVKLDVLRKLAHGYHLLNALNLPSTTRSTPPSALWRHRRNENKGIQQHLHDKNKYFSSNALNYCPGQGDEFQKQELKKLIDDRFEKRDKTLRRLRKETGYYFMPHTFTIGKYFIFSSDLCRVNVDSILGKHVPTLETLGTLRQFNVKVDNAPGLLKVQGQEHDQVNGRFVECAYVKRLCEDFRLKGMADDLEYGLAECRKEAIKSTGNRKSKSKSPPPLPLPPSGSKQYQAPPLTREELERIENLTSEELDEALKKLDQVESKHGNGGHGPK